MQYYLISLIISFVIFVIIQIYEYRKKQNEENDYYEPYLLFTFNNCLVFGIIYLVTTIISYYLYSSNMDIYPFKKTKIDLKTEIPETSTTNNIIKDDINPQILSKINDNFDIGLDPFNSDIESDISSVSSKSSMN
jgi:uncharacterized membrane protein